MNTVDVGWGLAGLLVLLAGGAALLVHVFALGRGGAVALAAVRAVAQLAVVSLVIGFVLRSVGWTAAFLALMVTAAP